MKVCVFGLWHLGCVTAACLASAGHEVTGLDEDQALIERLQAARAPLYEPGLDDLLADGLRTGRLRFTPDARDALDNVDIVWVTFDTPVDDRDVADVGAVTGPVRRLFPHLPDGALVLVSSQVPVGTTRALARDYAQDGGGKRVTFGYSPENLRLGKAIQVFSHPDRVVVGLETEQDEDRVKALLAPFTDKVIMMRTESAEMTKHAINAFLATSVVFANEVAALCEDVGADAAEVTRGLKSEARIGPDAYLSPGAAFAGGTLARDVAFLSDLGTRLDVDIALIPAIRTSNDWHRSWTLRKLQEALGALAHQRIAVLGLTYKPGTSTLRRSSAVELASGLIDRGAQVTAFDPAVSELPPEMKAVSLVSAVDAALAGASAAVVATEWPAFRDVDWTAALSTMRRRLVIDPNGFLSGILKGLPDLDYVAVGRRNRI